MTLLKIDFVGLCWKTKIIFHDIHEGGSTFTFVLIFDVITYMFSVLTHTAKETWLNFSTCINLSNKYPVHVYITNCDCKDLKILYSWIKLEWILQYIYLYVYEPTLFQIAPENTLASFHRANEFNVQGFETDIRIR